MALAFSILQAPFRFGLSEGVDPRQVPPGTLTTAENVVWRQSGRVEKRPGTVALGPGIVTGAGVKRLFTRGNELCATDGQYLYGYASSVTTWKLAGRVPDVALTWSTATDTTNQIYAYDSAVSSAGLRIDAWQAGDATSSEDLYAQVVDLASGTVLYPATRIKTSNARRVRVVVVGTKAIILTGDSNLSSIVAYRIDLTTFTLSGPTTLRNDVAQDVGINYGFDACVIGSNFVLAYTSTAPTIALYSYNSSLVQQASGSISSETTGATMVSVDGQSGESLFVAYQRIGTTTARIAVASPTTLAQVIAPSVVEATTGIFNLAVCRFSSNQCIIAYTSNAAGGVGYRVTSFKYDTGTGLDAGSERGTYGAMLLTRPFLQNFKCWMFVTEAPDVATTYTQNTCLVEIETTAKVTSFTPHRLAGVVDILIGGDYPLLTDGAPPSVATVSSTESSALLTFQSTLRTQSGFQYGRFGLRSVLVKTSTGLPQDMWRSVSYANEAFISGSVLTSYDGRATFDYGFLRGPTFDSLTVTNGGFAMAAGTYLYGAVDEFRSSTGLLYRSPTLSTGTATTSGGASKVDVVYAGVGLGNKQTMSTLFGTSSATPTVQALYRSVVGGTVLQRITTEPDTATTTYLDQTAESSTFADRYPDATYGLASRPAMYTAGGILDDYAPPSCITMFRHVDRLFVLSGDQRTWWYSKAFQDDNGVAPGFNQAFRIVFEEAQVAGATLDDKCIFFSATSISYMLGLGPAPNGTASDFSTPTRIQVDTGCSNPRSIVSTPDGIMYVNERGICLLTRGLEVVQIGKPVQTTLASYPHITSAVLVPEQSQVRFTCNNSATSPTAGVTLVYDYVERQWSTFRHTATGYSYGCPYADACLYRGEWTFVTPNGYAYQESSSTYLDGSAYVPMTIETAWVSASGPMSFVSVRNFSMHGQSQTDHDLTVSVGFDSASSYDQVAAFAAQSAVTTVGPEEFTLTIGTRRKCNTIRFKVADSTPTTGTVGTGRGPTWDMMALEVGVKTGTGNTPATRRA